MLLYTVDNSEVLYCLSFFSKKFLFAIAFKLLGRTCLGLDLAVDKDRLTY